MADVKTRDDWLRNSETLVQGSELTRDDIARQIEHLVGRLYHRTADVMFDAGQDAARAEAMSEDPNSSLWIVHAQRNRIIDQRNVLISAIQDALSCTGSDTAVRDHLETGLQRVEEMRNQARK